MENNIILFDYVKNHQWDKFLDLMKKDETIDINIRDSNFNYLIQYAIMFNKKDITTLLINRGCKLDIIDADGRSILFNPIKFNYIEILKLLLYFNNSVIGVSLVDIQDNTGNTALHYSIIFDNMEAFKLLIENDSNVLIRDNNTDDSLHLAVLYKRKAILDELLKIGRLNINSVNENGESALHYACNYNLNDIAIKLIDSKINVNIQDLKKKLNALMYCINLGLDELTFKLIPLTDLNTQDVNGNTVLHHAINMKNLKALDLIIKNNEILFNKVNLGGNTALHLFLMDSNNYKYDDILKILIENTDLNIQNFEGNTIIHILIENNIFEKYLDIIKKKQTKYFIKNNQNKTVLDIIKNDKKRYDNLLDTIVDSYYLTLTNNDKNWQNQWENDCKKDSKKKEECKKIIKDHVLKNKFSFPFSKDSKKIILDNGIFVDKCTYTGSPLDVLMGNLFLLEKYDYLSTILTKDFILNENVFEYLESLGENQGYKTEFLNFEIMWIYQKLFFPTNFEETINNILKNKGIKYIVMSLAIELNSGSHANILIWDIAKKEVSRFEPHGASSPVEFNYNENLLDDLLRNRVTCFDNKINYIKPKDYLPEIGFQKFEMQENETCTRIGDPNGFCAVWCVWWVDMRLKYNDIEQDKLVKKLMNRIREEGLSFKNLIRNYSSNITNLRDKFLKNIKIDVNDWYNDKYTDQQAEQLINEIIKKID